MQNRVFSTDSAKAAKAGSYGWLDAICYMSPSNTAGVGNLCSHASPICIALCLGLTSGQAGMVKDINSSADQDNNVRKSRREKAQHFMHNRAGFLLAMVREIDNLILRSAKLQFKLCIRPNGSTDIAWEGIRFDILRDRNGKAVGITLGGKSNLFDHYPNIPFLDYTKNHLRFNRPLPANYHLTFSRSETNEDQALTLLEKGVNVAVVFGNGLPVHWHGFTVIDGDRHDLRHLDPRGSHGYVVGLKPKGRAAKRDTGGFVVR